jgi:hypothetical protein
MVRDDITLCSSLSVVPSTARVCATGVYCLLFWRMVTEHRHGVYPVAVDTFLKVMYQISSTIYSRKYYSKVSQPQHTRKFRSSGLHPTIRFYSTSSTELEQL